GQAETAELRARSERYEVTLLLRVVAEGEDRSADDGILHAQNRGGRAVAGGDLFQRDRERNVIETRAAEALGHDDAVGAETAELVKRFPREGVRAIPFGRERREPLARAGTHRVADHLLRFVQQHGLSPHHLRVSKASLSAMPANTPPRTQRCADDHIGRRASQAATRAAASTKARSPTVPIATCTKPSEKL